MLACTFDLETSGFEADHNIILCACVKPFTLTGDGKVKVFRGDTYSTWNSERSDDSLLCKDLLAHLLLYDIWVAHNGVKFDVTFLRTRLVKAGRNLPPNKIVDPVKLARRHYRFGYNNLKSVAAHFGIFGKTEVLGNYWMQAKFDRSEINKKAMNYIVEHCIADVDVLEKLTNKIKYLSSKINDMGSEF